MYGHVILLSKRIIITACGQKSRSDGCAEEAKERKSEADVDGQHQARLDKEGIIGEDAQH